MWLVRYMSARSTFANGDAGPGHYARDAQGLL
ncbi:hypothetical protein OOU_Y34scaffold01073g1 [Pyricularia oryzae Y34]|uniref:Uncharacterized protein n=2 Tax=Pyricularia oryzae TaxID=318829 RepID=A0AA97NM53_PYRO3|nr:hypothetical protein OOU_Y34scaffold01073g1 [Pyricularia oryzae Y34]